MISRRGLFKALVGRRGPEEVPEAPRQVRLLPLHRPPGAVHEADFLAHCSRCGDCLRSCPHQAITIAGERFREAAGTPIIEAAEAPCRLCPDRPCVTACPTGVLRSENPTRMARAQVDQMECLAWQRSFCTVCSEHCPSEGAIALDLGRPRIAPSACTGCGICLFVCPAPRKAIRLLAEMDRPTRPPDPC